MKDNKKSLINREKKKKKIISRLKGSFDRPFVTVFKSNTAIYCSLIDMKNNKVLTSASSRELNKDRKNYNVDMAYKTGEILGEKIKALNVTHVVFNRNGYLYHGRVKYLADGIRSKGIVF